MPPIEAAAAAEDADRPKDPGPDSARAAERRRAPPSPRGGRARRGARRRRRRRARPVAANARMDEVRARGEVHARFALGGGHRGERARHLAVRHEGVDDGGVALRVGGRAERAAHLGVHGVHGLDAAGVLVACEPARGRRLRARRRCVRHRVRVHVRVARARGDGAHARDERARPVGPAAALARLERDVVGHLRGRHRVARVRLHLTKHGQRRERVVAVGVRLGDGVPRRFRVGEAVERHAPIHDAPVPREQLCFEIARATSPQLAHASSTVSSMRDCATRGACHVTPISSRHFSPRRGTSFLRHFNEPAT